MFKLPHVSTYKNRWVRRAVIIATLPIEIGRACYETCFCAWHWFKQP